MANPIRAIPSTALKEFPVHPANGITEPPCGRVYSERSGGGSGVSCREYRWRLPGGRREGTGENVYSKQWTRAARVAVLAVAGALLVAGPTALWAQEGKSASQSFLALATGAQETPSVDTPAVAFAQFTLTSDGKLSYSVAISGLKGKPTAMHLHRGKAGQAGDVIYPLATPTPEVALTTGSVDFKAEDVADLTTQGIYLNIHTDAFPGGEIRGQVVLSPAGLQISVKP